MNFQNDYFGVTYIPRMSGYDFLYHTLSHTNCLGKSFEPQT